MATATLGLFVLKLTLTTVLGLFVLLAAARASAAIRHRIVVATFVALAALPVAAAVLPPVVVPVLRDLLPMAASAGEPTTSQDAPAFATSHEPSGPFGERPTSGNFLLAGWGVGALLCLLPPLGALAQSRRLRREGDCWIEALSEAPPSGTWRFSRVLVLLHPRVAGPMTCGVLHPRILLPDEARRWGRDDLDRALVHEMSHVTRVDVLVHGLARCICAAYWFHPLVWVCWRALRREAERACDDAVIALYEPADYAQQLLHLARRQGARTASWNAMAHGSELATRIRAALDPEQRRERLGRRGAVAIATIGATCVAVLAPLTPVLVTARATGAAETFASASVARSRAGQPLSMESLSGGVVRITGAPLRRLVRLAYGVQEQAIVGAPAWMDSVRFDITATARPDTSPDARVQMLRSLLTERFDLRVGYEVRARPVLTLARSLTQRTGLRDTDGCRDDSSVAAAQSMRIVPRAIPPCGFHVALGRLEGRGVDLHALATALSTPLGQLVIVDGLARDRFDFVLTWNAGGDDPTEAVAEAVKTQLGLAIAEEQRRVPVIVIRSVRSPA